MAKIECLSWSCGSTNVVPVDTKKKFTIGKAVAGNIVGGFFGPAGAIVGTAVGIKGKDGETKFICQNCGKVFEKKYKFTKENAVMYDKEKGIYPAGQYLVGRDIPLTLIGRERNANLSVIILWWCLGSSPSICVNVVVSSL